MQGDFIDYFASFFLQATPAKAVIAGALLGGMLLGLIEILRARLQPAGSAQPSMPHETATPAEDRRLTCVVCKHTVKMKRFATHIAAHEAGREIEVLYDLQTNEKVTAFPASKGSLDAGRAAETVADDAVDDAAVDVQQRKAG